MSGGLSKNFHGVGIGPLSKILAVKSRTSSGMDRKHFTQTYSFKSQLRGGGVKDL